MMTLLSVTVPASKPLAAVTDKFRMAPSVPVMAAFWVFVRMTRSRPFTVLVVSWWLLRRAVVLIWSRVMPAGRAMSNCRALTAKSPLVRLSDTVADSPALMLTSLMVSCGLPVAVPAVTAALLTIAIK